MSPLKIEKWDSKLDGPLTEEALLKKLEKKGFNVTRYVYPPGTVFPDHLHRIDKIDAVLAGRFRMTMHNQDVILETGDCLAVPKGTVHSAAVVGEESVVSLDATKD